MSWAIAGDCALDAARINGRNCYYIGFDKEMAQQFINDAAMWAKAYNLLAGEVEEVVLTDEDEDIIAYRIRFASGYGVIALSSKPRNIRSKEGRFVFDEFAFHDAPEALLKAAIAVLMWGKSQIDIISSVYGGCPFFERLCNDIAVDRGYYVQETTLDDALADGLYKRICFVNGQEWTLEGEFAWRSQLIKEYGNDAEEELFCKADTDSKSLFSGEMVDACAIGQWQDPQERHSYLLCVDPNFGAIGEDFYALQVWDITKLPISLVYEYRDNEHGSVYHRNKTLEAIDLYDPLMVVFESNSGGKPMAENVQSDRPDIRVELVNTGRISKIQNTDRIALMIDQSECVYPADWAGISEMKKFSKLHRVALSGHDDTVTCFAAGMAWLEVALEECGTADWIGGV